MNGWVGEQVGGAPTKERMVDRIPGQIKASALRHPSLRPSFLGLQARATLWWCQVLELTMRSTIPRDMGSLSLSICSRKSVL